MKKGRGKEKKQEKQENATNAAAANRQANAEFLSRIKSAREDLLMARTQGAEMHRVATAILSGQPVNRFEPVLDNQKYSFLPYTTRIAVEVLLESESALGQHNDEWKDLLAEVLFTHDNFTPYVHLVLQIDKILELRHRISR